jgi:hypothetical protein
VILVLVVGSCWLRGLKSQFQLCKTKAAGVVLVKRREKEGTMVGNW